MREAEHILLLIILLLLPAGLPAQDDKNSLLLEQAEQDYLIGRFEQTLGALERSLNSFQGNSRQRAIRLVALSYMAMDDYDKAEKYARMLIELNNYYYNVNDPIRFEEMVNRLKAGRTFTVTTASSVSESITETPVPMTIITAEMIENLGANKNLNHILATYVPGMAEIQCYNSDNMAMHGAYGEEQELILVMENGHRLNSRTTNAFNMDYSISTEKIDHIEVLRGPASSLYGNVALSAVVNIITKNGSDINGVKGKIGYGSFNTQKAELTAGYRFMEADVFAWASAYQSDGQKRKVENEEEYREKFTIYPHPDFHAIVDAYKDRPSYDFGMTFRYMGFDMLFSRKSSKKVPQFSSVYGYYDYDRYRTYEGTKPGMTNGSTHLELGYKKKLDRIDLSVSGYCDWMQNSLYLPGGGEDEENEKAPWPDKQYAYGFFEIYRMHEHTLGGNLRASTSYQLLSMSGDILAGAQYEHYVLDDFASVIGTSYDTINYVSPPFDIARSYEKSLSFYAQDKHRFSSKVIMNIGGRYDIKYRKSHSKITAFSPRLALNYIPSGNFSARLTYSKAFVDMSYYYRAMEYVDSDEDYLPQYLTAMQLSVMGKIAPIQLYYEVNLFYNKYKNLNCRESMWDKKFLNEGRYENCGIEASLAYTAKRLNGMLTLYWCKDIKAEDYYYSEQYGRVTGVPKVTANLNVGWTVIQQPSHLLKIYGNANYQGSRVLAKRIFSPEVQTFVHCDYKKGGRAVFDLGVKYTYNKRLQMSVDCENLLDTDRIVTGPDYNMYPQFQHGRALMTTLAYSI